MDDRIGTFPERMTSFGGRLCAVSQIVADEMASMPPEKPTRLTIKHLMALFALIAVFSGAQWLCQHQAYRVERAAYHQDMEVFHGGGFPPNMPGGDAVLFVAVTPRCAKLVPFHREMRMKWERAARYPWLSVEPDPPEPR